MLRARARMTHGYGTRDSGVMKISDFLIVVLDTYL